MIKRNAKKDIEKLVLFKDLHDFDAKETSSDQK